MNKLHVVGLVFGVLVVGLILGNVVHVSRDGVLSLASLADVWSRFEQLLPLRRITATSSVAVRASVVKATQYSSPHAYEDAIIDAVAQASPAVVSIVITKDLPIIERCPYNPFGNLPPEFQDFFGFGFGSPFQFDQPCQKGSRRQEVGGGTGFIVSADGLIVTNKHVVADTAASFTALTNDGKKYDAKVLARSPVQDIAILKIKATGLPVVTLGDSDGIRLGQTAIAIGNALGEFRNTVSVGIVSGLARNVTAQSAYEVERIEGVIQTDAAINPGNSGGPLMNLRGEVIGMNTAIAVGAQNIGFAIPINLVKRDLESVKKNGKIITPYLGVRYVMITKELAERDKLPVDTGALLRGAEDGPAVLRDSPAAQAGLQAEDIITAVNGITIDLEHSLIALVGKYNVGDSIRLAVFRDGKTFEIFVVLGERK